MREILCKASLSNIKTSLKLFKLNIEFSLPPEGVGGSKFGHNYPYIFSLITGGGGGVKRGRTKFTISVVFFLRASLRVPGCLEST